MIGDTSNMVGNEERLEEKSEQERVPVAGNVIGVRLTGIRDFDFFAMYK